jgi:hypothetical protein
MEMFMRGMQRSIFVLVGLCASVTAWPAAQVPAAPTANPLAFFWGQSLNNIDLYEKPGGLIVAGNCNRYDPEFTRARAASR